MSLKLKNNWAYAGNEKWDWEVYLTSGDPSELDNVKSVKYILHSTFKNPVRVITNRDDNFKLKMQGWGTFEIKAFAILESGDKIRLTHNLELQFTPPQGVSD